MGLLWGTGLLRGRADADDDGAPIEGWVKTFLMDLGTGKQKRLPEVYVAFRGGDRLLLRGLGYSARVVTGADGSPAVEFVSPVTIPVGAAGKGRDA